MAPVIGMEGGCGQGWRTIIRNMELLKLLISVRRRWDQMLCYVSMGLFCFRVISLPSQINGLRRAAKVHYFWLIYMKCYVTMALKGNNNSGIHNHLWQKIMYILIGSGTGNSRQTVWSGRGCHFNDNGSANGHVKTSLFPELIFRCKKGCHY